MIVADAEARGCVFLNATEAFSHALSEGLECFMARAVESGVDADAFSRTVIDGDEDGDLAVLDGEGGGQEAEAALVHFLENIVKVERTWN